MKHFGIGAVIGLANLIPGVSGGTLAVIMGVYDRIIALTRKGGLRKDWPFLLKLLAGLVAAVLVCSKLLAFVFEKYQLAPPLVFFGVILGSLPMIYNIALSYCPALNGRRKAPASALLACGLCFAFMLAIALLKLKGVSPVPEVGLRPGFMLLLFVSGVLAAVSMVLPGISGSLMMVVIGVYAPVIAMLAALFDFSDFASHAYWQNALLFLPFLLGCLLGLVGGLRAVRRLLEGRPALMYFAILGLVAGSLFTVLPFDKLRLCPELYIGLLLAALAAVCTYKFSRSEI